MRYTIRELLPTASWTPGGLCTFDFQSILNEFRAWSFPCIHSMVLRWNPTFSTGASGGIFRLHPQGFASNILVQDVGGQRVNLSGDDLHILLKDEYGLRYPDLAATAANTGSGGTGASQEMFFPIPVMPKKSRRPRDYTIPVSSFLDGGSVQLTCGPATPNSGYYTYSTAELSLIIRVVEEGQPELKSRFLCRSQVIPSADYAGYIMGGFARTLIWYRGAASQISQTAWGAGQKLDSYTLNYQQVRDKALIHMRQLQTDVFRPDTGTVATASVVQSEDPFWTGQAVPLIPVQQDQKITDMIQMSTLHVRTNVAVQADSKLISTVLEERNPLASQRTFKRTDVGSAIEASGRVKTANGQKKKIGEFPADLVNVLPVKIDTGK